MPAGLRFTGISIHRMDCSGNGACCCDTCQEEYETAWKKQVEEDDLCESCGVPRVLSLEALMRTQYTHFFMPCTDCRDLLDSFLTAAGLCVLCRDKLQDGECARCDAAAEAATPEKSGSASASGSGSAS